MSKIVRTDGPVEVDIGGERRRFVCALVCLNPSTHTVRVRSADGGESKMVGSIVLSTPAHEVVSALDPAADFPDARAVLRAVAVELSKP